MMLIVWSVLQSELIQHVSNFLFLILQNQFRINYLEFNWNESIFLIPATASHTISIHLFACLPVFFIGLYVYVRRLNIGCREQNKRVRDNTPSTIPTIQMFRRWNEKKWMMNNEFIYEYMAKHLYFDISFVYSLFDLNSIIYFFLSFIFSHCFLFREMRRKFPFWLIPLPLRRRNLSWSIMPSKLWRKRIFRSLYTIRRVFCVQFWKFSNPYSICAHVRCCFWLVATFSVVVFFVFSR